MEVLKVERLSKNFGGLRVLQNVSFTLGIGEKVALIGPNGAGKTTLINVISGLLFPTAGRIYVSGRDVTHLPLHRRASLGLARSFQINTLFFNLTLLENAILAIQGTKHSYFRMIRPLTFYHELFTEAQKLLEIVGLWEKKDVPITGLSHGEQRQVEIALALASKPKLLLLDEPNAGLSIAETAAVINITRNLPVDTTVFFCGHDMDLVFSMADRVVVLYYGQIIAEGIPKEIQANTTVREIYLGAEEASSA
jgi:branched-chain amino acid transport system ATP-binding protein